MSGFDSIVVGNDLVSEHWLAEQFPSTVVALRAGWKEQEEHAKTTPRSGLIALSATFGADLVRLRERSASGSGDPERLRALHAAVRAALLIPGEETGWRGERAGTEITVPAVVPKAPSGTHLLVLQARDAESVEDLLDDDGAGHLLAPATVDGAEETSTARVISGAFLAEEPPALVLVTAGAWLLLAERGSWPEGGGSPWTWRRRWSAATSSGPASWRPSRHWCRGTACCPPMMGPPRCSACSTSR